MARLGRPRLHLRVTDSTNTRARELAIAGAPHGTVVTAGRQVAGRGRQGRTWSAPAGQALLCSLVIRQQCALLSLAAGVAVAEVVGEPARLKWPNDVLLAERKVAGILVEGRPQERWAVLGIGVNVAVDVDDLPEELSDTAGTLGLTAADIDPMLDRLLHALERWLGRPPGEIVEEFGRRDALRGELVSWGGGHGRVDGIDEQGQLLVATGDGHVVALSAGEVHLTR
jgi:BirA family transcriptional regulator, biotin operon repressor / biotin---[acetyl-CoA-carboxylase] ligase